LRRLDAAPRVQPRGEPPADPADRPLTSPGTTFVLVAARTEDVHGRIVLDVEWVQHLLRELGWLTINRVAAQAGATKPRRGTGRRVEKSAHIDDKTVTLAERTTRTIHLYSEGGALGIAELAENGELIFEPLPRVRTHRNQDKNGRYRFYNDYRLSARYEHQVTTVRLHGNDEDNARKLNRTENLRPIPPGDPDFERLFPRRNDAESINRHLDTMWLARAHSIGHLRQQLNLLGFALTVNSLALHRHRRKRVEALAA
jgi:hypothetical protein